MNVEQAINVIDRATALIRGTRQDHMAIARALEVIQSHCGVSPQPGPQPKPQPNRKARRAAKKVAKKKKP